jgi:hypothetical protein
MSVLHRQSPLLELLHPDGHVQRALILGSNCPARLIPEIGVCQEGYADLIVLAPTPAECRAPGWLNTQIRVVIQELARDGIVYLLARWPWRSRILGLLRRHGLTIDAALGHIPDWSTSSYLVPLDAATARYAFTKLLNASAVKRCLAVLAFRLPAAGQIGSRILSQVGVIVRHPGARPLFEWLFQASQKGQQGTVILRTTWRGSEGTIILHGRSLADPYPSVVAKLAGKMQADRRIREAALLARLGPGARDAGAEVPRPLELVQVGASTTLIQNMVHGQSVAALLAAEPDRCSILVEQITSWLLRWHQATRIIQPLRSELLQMKLLVPLTILAPYICGSREYHDWLAARCCAAIDALAPMVAAHNDLTMWNIVVTDEGRLGILDWETACQESLPLVDFFYAVTDAVAAAHSYTDRLAAFEACFAPSGAYRSMVARLLQHLSRILQIAPNVVELCFHACWLHHALNEHHASRPGEPRPFLQIVQTLAQWRSYVVEVGG